jgi:hypothetical protein
MWVLEFEAPKVTRCHRYFMWVTCTCLDGYQIRQQSIPDGGSLWWSDNDKKWMRLEDIGGSGATYCPVNTLKAFKRHLRKHPELKGRRVTLASRYQGLNVHAEWRGLNG